MKIRNCFVSNSSSSSFLIMAPTSKVEEVTKDYSPYQKEILRYIRNDRKFLGTGVSIFEYATGNDDTFEYYELPDGIEKDDNFEYHGQVIAEFSDQLSKVAGEDFVSIRNHY